MSLGRRNPKARVAIQTERDPLDKAEERRQSRELKLIRLAITAGLGTLNTTLLEILAHVHPKAVKATHVSIADIQAEPLVGPPPEEVPMAQFHVGQEGCKATLVFNGQIDGEPTLTVVGTSALLTVDPKTEVASEDPTDPDSFVETRVVLHFKNNGSLPAGIFGVSGSALADNPDTADQEAVTVDFPEVGEYIPVAQAKANSVSLITESEPL